MQDIRLISWNVNGIRSLVEKEVLPGVQFDEYLTGGGPDICCLQETKADASTYPLTARFIGEYQLHLTSGVKKGYSGVALYTRIHPVMVRYGIGIPECDTEGRIIIATYDLFTLYTVYFPNGGASAERLAYKLRFYEAMLQHLIEAGAAGERIILCGDINTAHHPEDLARPKENESRSGFLPVERDWMDRLVQAGFVDTYRMFEPGGGHYTWWDYKTRARTRNVGWRLDYFFVNTRMKEQVITAGILTDILGSDHCPVSLTIRV